MKHSKTIDTATIARLLSHEDEHGMGRVFMYTFLNEVIRQKQPFPFDCESAQVSPNLLIVDNQGRSIAVELKRNRLCLTLNDQHTEALSDIEYKGKAYRQVILAWLSACIQYTSLQPELRNKLSQYANSIRRRNFRPNLACATVWRRLFISLRHQIADSTQLKQITHV